MNPTLLHSVSYAGFWGQAALSLDAFVDKAADLGYGGVMLMAKRPHLSVLDYDASRLANLRERLERRGLREIVIAGYNDFTTGLDRPDIPHREYQIAHVTHLAQMAQALGAKSVRIFTGYEYPSVAYSAQWKLVVDTLRECSKRAADLGVTLGVQNHHDLAAGYETLHDLLQTVDHPSCRAMFDAWAPYLQGTDLRAAATRMGPLTVHTTIADYQRRPRYRYDANVVNYLPATPLVQAVPMGEGEIDYATFLRNLRDSGFTGSIAYEMCSPLLHGGDMATLDRYATRFLEFLCQVYSEESKPCPRTNPTQVAATS
jgi:sugar phosphate isomerase/epimerase